MTGFPLPRNIQKSWRRATLSREVIADYVTRFCPERLRGPVVETRIWEARRSFKYQLRRVDVLFEDGRFFSLRLRATGEAIARTGKDCCV